MPKSQQSALSVWVSTENETADRRAVEVDDDSNEMTERRAVELEVDAKVDEVDDSGTNEGNGFA